MVPLSVSHALIVGVFLLSAACWVAPSLADAGERMHHDVAATRDQLREEKKHVADLHDALQSALVDQQKRKREPTKGPQSDVAQCDVEGHGDFVGGPAARGERGDPQNPPARRKIVTSRVTL